LLFLFSISTIFMFAILTKFYGKVINPFSVLTLPFLSIFLFNNIIGINLGFYRISDQVMVFVLLIFISFFISNLLVLLFSSKMNRKIKRLRIKKINFAMKIAMSISLFSFILLFIKAYFKIGLDNFFSDNMGLVIGQGIFAHISMLGYPAFIYFSYRFFIRKNKLSLFFMFSYLFFSFGSMTKYHVIFPIIGAFILISFYVDNLKIIKYSIMLFTVIIILFISNYSIYFNTLSFEIIQWASNHIILYIIGGSIVFSQMIDINLMFYSTISLFERISNVLLPTYFSKFGISFFPSAGYMTISDTGAKSNVSTFFGSAYYFLDFFGVIVLIFILGLIVSTIYIIALKSENLILRIFSAHFMTIIFLMFFGNYFSLLGIWERGFWILFIPLLTIFQNKKMKIKFKKMK